MQGRRRWRQHVVRLCLLISDRRDALLCGALFFLQLMQVQIFCPGGHSAPDMAFLFILIQHLLDFCIQIVVDLIQSFGDVFVNGAFADSEIFGGASYRGLPL